MTHTDSKIHGCPCSLSKMLWQWRIHHYTSNHAYATYSTPCNVNVLYIIVITLSCLFKKREENNSCKSTQMQLFLTLKTLLLSLLCAHVCKFPPHPQQVCGNQKTASGVTSPTPILVLMGSWDKVQVLRLD